METMKEILNQNQSFKPPQIGDIVEGKVIAKKSTIVFLDLGIYGTGIIYGKEFKRSKEELKKLKIGEKILAKIIDLDNEEGYIELSISGASKEIALELLRQKKEAQEKVKVEISAANKGGLLAKVSGIPAFLPVSQLALENYPQVEDGDSEKIFNHLKKFIGKEMEVKILGILEGGQVILSEKLAKLEKEENLEKYQVGDLVEGEISAILDYGIFLKFDDNEGLIPISEISSPFSDYKMGQKLRAKILSIENKKIFLTLKI